MVESNYLMNKYLPIKGVPTLAAMPWNSRMRPNALVNFSNPMRSTTRIDLSAANTAVNKINPLKNLTLHCLLMTK